MKLIFKTFQPYLMKTAIELVRRLTSIILVIDYIEFMMNHSIRYHNN